MNASSSDIDWLVRRSTESDLLGQIIGPILAGCFVVLCCAVLIAAFCYAADYLESLFTTKGE